MRPRALDLFCGAGGVSVGLERAGFDVTGVDIKPQPRYRGGVFVQGDALVFPLEGYDFIWASPPCQRYSVANNIWAHGHHPDYVEIVRERLAASGAPWVIENVPGAPLRNPVTICGLALGLGVKRHRWFESTVAFLGTECPPGHPGDWVCVFGHTVLERSPAIGRTAKNGPIFRRRHLGVERGRQAMGIDWMNCAELSQAIPPAYAEYIGRQVMRFL